MRSLRTGASGPLSLAGAAFAVLACADGGVQPVATVVSSITIEQADVRILLGNQLRVAASAFDQSGVPVADPDLSWESSDPRVVTVDGTGLMQAVGPGDAAVRAEAGTGEAVVTVAVPEPLAMVGAAGASLSGPGGNVRLVIPPGALTTERPISVAAAVPESLPGAPGTDDLVPGTAYEFGPSGLSFNEPVRLTMLYDAAQLASGVFTDQLRIYRASESGWTEAGGGAAQRSGQEVSASISGFSVYAVGVDSNRAPTVAFTVDCSGLDCDFIDQSTDPDGTIATRGWDFGDGVASDIASPSHSFGVSGEFTVTLTVTDDGGASASTFRSVTVSVDAPVASFIADCEDLTCGFTDQSVDGDGTIVDRAWDFGDGTTSTQVNPSHGYDEAGSYTVTLTVTDDDGLTDATQQSISVTDPPGLQPPTAAFTFSCEELECRFTDESEDSDGSIMARAWAFGDGASSTATNPLHSYATAGTYTVSLEVTNDDGLFDTATRSVTVSDPPGRPPVASFTVDCAGVSCQFTDTSTDPDGIATIVERSWDFGDGATSSEPDPSHDYSAGGDYTVTLTVTDDEGSMDEDEQTVTIIPQLVNGEALNGLIGEVGEMSLFQIVLPAGQASLTVEIEGTGAAEIGSDADLFLRFGSAPTTLEDSPCMGFVTGDDEICVVDSPAAGVWYIGLFGAGSGLLGFDGVTLTATYGSPETDLDLAGGLRHDDLAADPTKDHILAPDGRIMHRSEATFVRSRMTAR